MKEHQYQMAGRDQEGHQRTYWEALDTKKRPIRQEKSQRT
jgi:hypothetical protein